MMVHCTKKNILPEKGNIDANRSAPMDDPNTIRGSPAFDEVFIQGILKGELSLYC